jgi:hypothetical protein
MAFEVATAMRQPTMGFLKFEVVLNDILDFRGTGFNRNNHGAAGASLPA